MTSWTAAYQAFLSITNSQSVLKLTTTIAPPPPPSPPPSPLHLHHHHHRPSTTSITNSQSLFKLMSIESVMPSSHLILHHPLLLLPPIPPSIRVFSNESTLHMRCVADLLEEPRPMPLYTQTSTNILIMLLSKKGLPFFPGARLDTISLRELLRVPLRRH